MGKKPVNHEVLNYSDGRSFQILCERIRDSIENRQPLTPYKVFVENECNSLIVKRSVAWGRTASQRSYFEYLTQLNQVLSDSATSEEITSLIEKASSITREKIHVLFITQEPSCWPSIESVYDAAVKNENYCVSLVYTPFEHTNYLEQKDYYSVYHNELGLPILNHDEYDLLSDSPDVAVMIKPYENVPVKYLAKNILQSVPRVVYIPYGMEITTDLIKYGFQYYLHDKAWRHCAYGKVVKDYAAQYGFQNGENVVVWGHPKADHYLTEHEPSQKLKDFIAGRKTILWTPHHLVNLEETGTGTWLLLGKEILNIALNSPDIAFIFRPHPLMMGALIKGGYMSQREADEMRRTINNSSNIYWDEDGSYIDDFYAADAIITDGTTFSIEFLYTKKPIILTPRNMSSFYACDQMMESYYIASSSYDIGKYIDMVRRGEDTLYEKRMKMRENLFFIPEGKTVGENIMENIKTDLDSECEAEITEYIENVQEQTVEETIEKKIPELFSILVLTYQNVNMLYGMLNSIFKQDYPRIQLIVSDDGSEDFSVAEIEDYIAKRANENIVDVRVLKNPENLGTVKHIAKAVQAVDGKYFVFTAADDRFYVSDAISKYAEEFDSNPDCGWIVAKARITTADYKNLIYTTPTEKDVPYFTQRDPLVLYSRWSRRGMAIPCNMAFRRSTFEEVGGFDLRYKFLEDWPLVLRLLRLGYMPSYLDYETAIHSTGGITNSNSYGIAKREMFFDDKKLLLQDETASHFDLLRPEDRKAFNQYCKEILDRQYFFSIYLPKARAAGKMSVASLLLSKPIYLSWYLSDWYNRNKGREIFKRKKMLAYAQVLFLMSAMFEFFSGASLHRNLLNMISVIDFLLAIVLVVISVLSYGAKRIILRKEKLRKELVN